MKLLPVPSSYSAAAGNVVERLVRGHWADLRPMPHTLVDSGPQRTLVRYRRIGPEHGLPILLVPPLAAPALAFDLRRGCSLAEHLVTTGRRTYLVDYGPISFAQRGLGIEHWVRDVLPAAIQATSADAGGQPVHVVGWCLGGIFALLTAADHPQLPIATLSAIATPLDVSAVPLVAPLRPLAQLTGGRVLTTVYRVLGSAPAPLVRYAFQLSSVDRYLTKPLAIWANLDDRDFLAQVEAVDNFTAHMLAYPGRTFGQLYHRMLRHNDLAAGYLELEGRRIELAKVSVPALIVAGTADTIAPIRAVRRAAQVLVGAPEVRFFEAPGGHLGVLTGRRARETTWAYLDSFFAGHDSSVSGLAAFPALRAHEPDPHDGLPCTHDDRTAGESWRVPTS